MAILTSRDRDFRPTFRSMLLMLSFACIAVPLPLLCVTGYLVAAGQAMNAYRTALAAVCFCMLAIAAYFMRRAI